MIRLRWLVLGVVALPFVEFAAFWWVAGRVGVLPALLGVVATSALGIMILKGGAAMLFAQLRTGRILFLTGGLAKGGMLTAFAGLLLAIPGFVTDLMAVALMVPAVRAVLFGAALPATRGQGRAPARPGVLDLDPADWREERRRDPGRPRPPRVEGP